MNARAVIHHWAIPAPGETIAGKYVVDGTLGRGSSAVVLSAVHAQLGERVAIKVLLPDSSGDAAAVERFLREGRAARRIESEHMARVLDVGILDSGAPYVVTECLVGDSLKEVLAKWQPLPIATAVDWIVQACEAVGEAHLHGLVHGDLKPANLLVAPRSRAGGVASIKVVDFGLSTPTDVPMAETSARLTGTADVMGSPHYMAPEQLRASCETDARTDIWALGAVLYELLAGEPPFLGNTLPQVCAAVLTERPRALRSLRSEVPPDLDRCILLCLDKDPAVRFATALELSRELTPFGSHVARESLARLERTVAAGVRVSRSSPSLLPPLSSDDSLLPDEAMTEPFGLPRRGAASARVVLGSLLMLTGVGVAAFLAMYGSVHGSGPLPTAGFGVTATQATANHAELLPSISPPAAPAPPPAAASVAPASLPLPVQAASVLPSPPSADSAARPGGAAPPGGAQGATGALSRAQRPVSAARPPVRRTVVHVAPRPAPPAGDAPAPEGRVEVPARSPTPADEGTPSSGPAAGAAAEREPAKAEANPYEQETTGGSSQPPTGDPFQNRN